MRLDQKPAAEAALVAVEAEALAVAVVAVLAVVAAVGEEAAIVVAVVAEAVADTKDWERKKDAGFWPASLSFVAAFEPTQTLLAACVE